MVLHYANVEPAYRRIYNRYRSMIVSGELQAGSQVPTEREICLQFDVSRITSRRALQLLQDEGLVERHAGRGTFVRHRPDRRLRIRSSDFVGSMAEVGPRATRELLFRDTRMPPPSIRHDLSTLREEPCVVASRLDLIDGEPLAYDEIWMTIERAPPDDVLADIGFLKAWETWGTFLVAGIEQEIEAQRAGRFAVAHLGVPRGAPILVTRELVRAERRNEVFAAAVVTSYYRPDRCSLVSTVGRRGTSRDRS